MTLYEIRWYYRHKLNNPGGYTSTDKEFKSAKAARKWAETLTSVDHSRIELITVKEIKVGARKANMRPGTLPASI